MTTPAGENAAHAPLCQSLVRKTPGNRSAFTESLERDTAASVRYDALAVDHRRWVDKAFEAEQVIANIRALHPKIEAPRHGCCAHPKLCNGHPPECGGKDHGINRPTWPCPTIALLPAAPTEEGAEHAEGPATVTHTDLRPAEHASPDYKHGYGDALRDAAARVGALTADLAAVRADREVLRDMLRADRQVIANVRALADDFDRHGYTTIALRIRRALPAAPTGEDT